MLSDGAKFHKGNDELWCERPALGLSILHIAISRASWRGFFLSPWVEIRKESPTFRVGLLVRRYLLSDLSLDELSDLTPLPVVELAVGTCVSIIIEFGPMIIVTGSPPLSFALTRKEPGTTLTSVKPSCSNLDRICAGRFCVGCAFDVPAGLSELAEVSAARAGTARKDATVIDTSRRANMAFSH